MWRSSALGAVGGAAVAAGAAGPEQAWLGAFLGFFLGNVAYSTVRATGNR
ncbi:MAG: hypothetical protein ABEJ68_07805 [Halobacteriaceae archaeon]